MRISKENENPLRFNHLDFSYGLAFFRVRPGVLVGLGDIEGFVGSEVETMEWISHQFDNDKKIIDALSSGMPPLPDYYENERETHLDIPIKPKR